MLEGGAGPPVVLLHGPGAYAAAWLRVIPGLVTTHRVIAPDLRIAEAASLRHGWPLHVIEDAADDPTIDQPEAFLNALRNALGEEAR